MAPRKPPPLDKSLFVGNGPLAPGSAPLPPSPFKVHPAYVIDGHSFPDRPTTDSTPIFGGLPESYPRPPVRSAIQVKTNVSAEPAPAILGVKPFSIHPTILNLTLATPPSITNIAKGAVDIIVPCTYPLTEKEWDLLDEAVKALDGTWGREAKEAEGQTDPDPSAPARSPVGRGGKIVISGLFPPPLTKQSEALLTDKAFNLHVTRLSQLSFHANVYLKALPPVVDANALPGQSWWTDRKEVERVLKVYAMPSIETFGTHRLIYGSSPALPLADLAQATGADTDLQQPISSEEWYGVIRRVVTEIGEGASAITDFMGGNAANVYGLQV